MSKYDNLPQLIIRGAAGLGDSVYLYPIVEHYTHIYKDPQKITVCSFFPDVFKPLGVKTEPFRRNDTNMCATYAHNRTSPNHQYKDILTFAGLPDIPFKIRWKVQNEDKLKEVRKKYEGTGKEHLVLIPYPHRPFNNKQNKFSDLEIDYRIIQEVINRNKNECCFLLVGKLDDYRPIELSGIDIDMRDKTRPDELMDISTICDVFLCPPSYPVPISQGFKKKLFCILSSKMINSQDKTLRMLKPHKYKLHSWDVVIWDSLGVDAIDKEFKKCLSL